MGRPDFAEAARVTGAVVAAIRDDQLAGPTPSLRYTVADLVDHLDGLSAGLASTARKEPPAAEPRPGDGSLLAPGWRERIPAQLATLATAWADPAAWEGVTTAGTIELEAAAAGMFALDEIVVHGWELARSTGQAYETDDAAVQAVADFLEGVPRSEELFGPVVAVPDGAPAIDRLVGLTGRDPAWGP
ncbi:MAG: TIGR03086 family protein [Pseudonocardiaceae bacterium]|nr:MAG: TIGR03086 family protein [Pseudonocardiaceae bacterium]